jgi:multidrug efflux system outer membrane protein
VADIGWRDFLVDERLEQLVALALENNRDLRIAVLNVERARAQWGIRRADLVPSVGGGVFALRQRLPASQTGSGRAETFTQYNAEVGISSYELDLFGRVRSLSRAALEQLFAREEARRGAQIALIAEVAAAYLTLAADRELQRLAEETVESQESSFRLTEQRYELGAVSGLEVSQARTTVESARVDAARFAGNVAQDLSFLTLLVGAPVDPTLLPSGFALGTSGLEPLPAGLPSEVLLRRPDVLAAEHLLRGANASVGAARAAYFPRIALTASGGVSSDELSSLFDSGNTVWSFLPQVSIPIFQGGRLRANRQVAETDRALAVAEYERAIQVGFREVSDALALTSTLARQRAAQEALAAAAGRAYELSQARYDSGRDSYLILLDSQRVWYGAQQGLIVTRLAEQANRVGLYRVLGGGWVEGGE